MRVDEEGAPDGALFLDLSLSRCCVALLVHDSMAMGLGRDMVWGSFIWKYHKYKGGVLNKIESRGRATNICMIRMS